MNGGRRERRRRRVAARNGAGDRPRIRVVRDAEEVFREAILAGVLSAERSDRNWAGHYLYLFHDEDGAAWFRHRDTRARVPMRARRGAAAGDGW